MQTRGPRPLSEGRVTALLPRSRLRAWCPMATPCVARLRGPANAARAVRLPALRKSVGKSVGPARARRPAGSCRRPAASEGAEDRSLLVPACRVRSSQFSSAHDRRGRARCSGCVDFTDLLGRRRLLHDTRRSVLVERENRGRDRDARRARDAVVRQNLVADADDGQSCGLGHGAPSPRHAQRRPQPQSEDIIGSQNLSSGPAPA
jgi:hypothetical protein